MQASYTKIFNLCNLRLFLFAVLFIISGCQIDQSVSILKEKLFSDTDELETDEKKISKSLEFEKKELKESSKNKVSQQNNEKTQEDRLEVKSTNYKSKIDLTLQQKELKDTNILPLKKMGQTKKTDKKIISFFTKFFEGNNSEDFRDKDLPNDSNIQKIETKVNKNSLRTESDKLAQLNKDSQENTGKSEILEGDSFSSENIQKDLNDVEYPSEEVEDAIAKNNSVVEEVNDSKKKSSGYAFLNLKKPELKEKKIETDNLVGLLLPLTGEKSAAGNLVINSLRYSMLLRPNQLNFKIYDTKGTPRGAVNAAEQAISNDVKTFIGPIFSDETREVKEHFQNNRRLTFFSLSPDLNNVSENIIVSGQIPNDQMSCITKHIATNDNSNVLLIYHPDKYGYVIKNSFLNYVNDFGMMGVNIEFFEVEADTDLNNEIKKISRFNERKQKLENEIMNIENNTDLEDQFKKSEIKSLERMLTLGSPFDSIIIASEGNRLLEILSHLAFYDINSENSNIYGTSLWEDTNKKDNLFKGTFYASSLKYRDDEFVKNFKNVFSKDPMSFNYHMHDLLDLVANYKTVSEKEKKSLVFNGEFTKSKIQSGFLQREIYLKKIKRNRKSEEVFNCRLNVI